MGRAHPFATVLVIVFATCLMSCSDADHPLEARYADTAPETAAGGPRLGSGPVLLADDFDAGLDTGVWFLETAGNVQWTHHPDGYIWSPPQSPYDWGNRFTDILTHRDDFEDFELTCDLRMNNSGWHADQRIIHLRGGDVPFPPGYYLFFAAYKPTVTPPNFIEIRKVRPDFSQEFISPTIEYPWVVGEWYSFRIVAAGNVIKVRVWPRDGQEPEDWTLEGYDPENLFTSGKIGFGDYWGSITDVDNVAVTSLCRTVDIDIKPGSCPNPYNAKPAKGGVLPAAILGTEEFDVGEIDLATVTLEGIAPIMTAFEDVATPAEEGGDCACTAEGADGYMDLIMKFDSRTVTGFLGSVSEGDEIAITISGRLVDGSSFEGYDCMVIVGLKSDKEIIDK